MEKLARRTFLKFMGQCSAVCCLGLPGKKAMAQESPVSRTRPKRIAVEEHITWKTYLDNGDRLDHKEYRPVFQKLNELDVPMFLHPTEAHPDGEKLYEGYPELASKIYGYAADVHGGRADPDR